MKVQVVSFHCVLKNKLGRVISTSFNQGVLTKDESPDSPLKTLTESLGDIQKGEKREVFVSADKAYGFYDLSKVKTVALDFFNEEPSIGKWIRMPQDQISYRVTELNDDMVTLDANHPLAGQDLIFEIEAVEARVATPDEILEQAENDRAKYH